MYETGKACKKGLKGEPGERNLREKEKRSAVIGELKTALFGPQSRPGAASEWVEREKRTRKKGGGG